jgi:NAD(P)-dependent dehydrogenase (short-subunit alcohol dehydrogenase family)
LALREVSNCAGIGRGFKRHLCFTTNIEESNFRYTQEVANMVVYIYSPQASATTGAALRVDGGVVNFIA